MEKITNESIREILQNVLDEKGMKKVFISDKTNLSSQTVGRIFRETAKKLRRLC